ncbi:MAG: hypothetical protein C5B56_13565 [Proteobacteria bacterium]|nr:MAG: hypothetical protein C5B56_13565 [Pseudomonadota bacterium]
MREPMTPAQAEFWLQEVLLPLVKNESRITKSVLEAIPSSGSDYRPDPHAKSAIELAWHIASAERRFLDTVINANFDATPVPRPDSIGTGGEVACWYAEFFDDRFPKLTQLQGDHLIKLVDFRGLFQWPAVAFLQLAVVHSVHHRGQLSTYLRPAGGRVPAIYGESYDSAEARKAAQAQAS